MKQLKSFNEFINESVNEKNPNWITPEMSMKDIYRLQKTNNSTLASKHMNDDELDKYLNIFK
jgi:hypothetical protein